MLERCSKRSRAGRKREISSSRSRLTGTRAREALQFRSAVCNARARLGERHGDRTKIPIGFVCSSRDRTKFPRRRNEQQLECARWARWSAASAARRSKGDFNARATRVRIRRISIRASVSRSLRISFCYQCQCASAANHRKTFIDRSKIFRRYKRSIFLFTKDSLMCSNICRRRKGEEKKFNNICIVHVKFLL